jgi:hypothetical protein
VGIDKKGWEDMTQSKFEQFGENARRDYMKLLDLLGRVLGADNLSSFLGDDNERILIARGLTNKLLEHAVTVLYLSRGTKQSLPSFGFNFFDSASIDVLTRAVFEAFLTFHYVFYEPKTKEERDYRYWCYKAAGIAERQNARVSTEEQRQKQAAEKKELGEVHEKLKSNVVFRSLTEAQRTRFFEGKEINLWRWGPDIKKVLSWRELAVDAGLSETLASDRYRHLSGRVHSSSLSVVQTIGDHVDREDKQVISGSIGTINVVIANMIKEYCGLFPKAREVLSRDSTGSGIVNWWIQVDRTLDEFNK